MNSQLDTQAKCIEWAKEQEKIRMSPEGKERWKKQLQAIEDKFRLLNDKYWKEAGKKFA